MEFLRKISSICEQQEWGKHELDCRQDEMDHAGVWCPDVHDAMPP
jgi:hypothetical protein